MPGLDVEDAVIRFGDTQLRIRVVDVAFGLPYHRIAEANPNRTRAVVAVQSTNLSARLALTENPSPGAFTALQAAPDYGSQMEVTDFKGELWLEGSAAAPTYTRVALIEESVFSASDR